uniref:Uncharacterized protein n=1 Tax=Gasterosteus aculeatus aculeatus TaxID=481459 RepID=A0AAQ4QXR5_GASAC
KTTLKDFFEKVKQQPGPTAYKQERGLLSLLKQQGLEDVAPLPRRLPVFSTSTLSCIYNINTASSSAGRGGATGRPAFRVQGPLRPLQRQGPSRRRGCGTAGENPGGSLCFLYKDLSWGGPEKKSVKSLEPSRTPKPYHIQPF